MSAHELFDETSEVWVHAPARLRVVPSKFHRVSTNFFEIEHRECSDLVCDAAHIACR